MMVRAKLGDATFEERNLKVNVARRSTSEGGHGYDLLAIALPAINLLQVLDNVTVFVSGGLIVGGGPLAKMEPSFSLGSGNVLDAWRGGDGCCASTQIIRP